MMNRKHRAPFELRVVHHAVLIVVANSFPELGIKKKTGQHKREDQFGTTLGSTILGSGTWTDNQIRLRTAVRQLPTARGCPTGDAAGTGV
jgi:NO-binding membrane sensor protein with MHYT domain